MHSYGEKWLLLTTYICCLRQSRTKVYFSFLFFVLRQTQTDTYTASKIQTSCPLHLCFLAALSTNKHLNWQWNDCFSLVEQTQRDACCLSLFLIPHSLACSQSVFSYCSRVWYVTEHLVSNCNQRHIRVDKNTPFGIKKHGIVLLGDIYYWFF